MVLLNDFKRQWTDVRDDVLAAVEAVGQSGWYILGKEVEAFEAALAGYWGLRHAVGVASGLDALEISLRVLGCKAGDRVLTSPISAFATTLAIVKIGAVPVFVDCDRFGLVDLERARQACAGRGDIRFFVPVHLYGNSLDLDRLEALRDEFSLAIVEDCAQSIGASGSGRATGSVGQMAATSFYPTKNLGAFGDGGAILANDTGRVEAARALRDYGQSRKYWHDRIGYNSRLDELQAALLHRAFLPRLAGWIARRRVIAQRYLEAISHPGICPLGAPGHSDSCWHLFPVLVDPERKSDFMKHLRDSGVACAEHYPYALMDQPAMAEVQWDAIGDFSEARRICRSEVSLPIHPYLTDEEAGRVIEVSNRWPG